MTEEITLAHMRTHPKVLFWPAVLQILLLVAHVAVLAYWPAGGFGISWVKDWGQLVVHGILAVLEIGYAVLPALRWWNATFTVTNLRVRRRWGIIWKNSYEVPISRITSISAESGLLDRIFRCGTLVLNDAGFAPQPANSSPFSRATGDGKMSGVRFYDVPRVQRVREILDGVRYGHGDGS